MSDMKDRPSPQPRRLPAKTRVAVIILFFSPKEVYQKKQARPSCHHNLRAYREYVFYADYADACHHISLKTGCGCARYLRQQVGDRYVHHVEKTHGPETNPEYEHQKRDKRRGLPQVYVADIAMAVRLPMAGFIAMPLVSRAEATL